MGASRLTARTLMLTYGIDAQPGLYGLYQQHRSG